MTATIRKQALEEAMEAIRRARRVKRRGASRDEQHSHERDKGIEAALEAVQDLLDVDVRRI